MPSGMNYLTLWHAGSGTQWWSTGLTFTDFKAKDQGYFNQGLRLVSMRVTNGLFTGVWQPGAGAQWWASGLSLDDFKAKDKAYFDQGLRLVDMEVSNGSFSAVWRPGSGAQWWASGLSLADFKAKDKGYFDQGLRLVCLRDPDGKYTAVWQPGSGAQWWATEMSLADFKAKDQGYFNQGLYLMDLEVRNGKFTAVWRPGAGAQHWYVGDDLEMLRSHDYSYFSNGLRLKKIFPYTGSCDSECLNQVVMPTGTYNYGITRTAQHCPGLPGTCGTPAANDVVFYRWPCITFDGSKRYARLSALNYPSSPNLTLPFSDTAVKERGPWLYSPGNWHHAIDFSRNDVKSFPIRPVANGTVIFIGWDWWSGNTMVISHDAGGVKDAFRSIYMHLRNGPTHDADQAWNITVPLLSGVQQTQYKGYLTATGCPKGGPYHPNADFWGSDADKIDMGLLGKNVTTAQVVAHAGCTGPGGCGCTDTNTPNWTWGGGVNTHLHLFLAHKDPSDNEWYFIDPYGIYSDGDCYPAFNAPVDTPCARYPVAWKGRKAQYP